MLVNICSLRHDGLPCSGSSFENLDCAPNMIRYSVQRRAMRSDTERMKRFGSPQIRSARVSAISRGEGGGGGGGGGMSCHILCTSHGTCFLDAEAVH